jgi:phosphatidylinositol glycan class M
LYHLTRLDHRHNFSHHFYAIYLQLWSSAFASLGSAPLNLDLKSLPSTLLNSSFVPQLGVVAILGIFLGRRASLPFAMFVQTLTFTTFNRVCTSQYFMWSLWFLPLVLHELYFDIRWEAGGWILLLAWVAGQAVWLRQAYGTELLGEASFMSVWAASALLFAIHAWLIVRLLGAYCRPAAPGPRLKTA